MVKPTLASTSGTPASLSKRKRSTNEDASIASSSKRTYTQNRKSRDRSRTPLGKNARFPPDLIKGPTPGDPARARSQSPTRPALHKRNYLDDGPSAQLHAEQDASLRRGTTPRLQASGRKRDLKPSSASRAAQIEKKRTGLTTGLNHITLESAKRRKSKSPALSKARSETFVDDMESAKSILFSMYTDGPPLDDDVCQTLDKLRSDAMAIAKTCPAIPTGRKAHAFETLLIAENEHLVRYIGCLAMGGPTGEEGWQTLLADETCRQALVLGIIGRALQENVFGALYFGGCEKLTEALKEQEEKLTHQDGFFRTQGRARMINKHKSKHADEPIFRKDVVRVTLQLESLLLPLWQQGTGTDQVWDALGNREKLAAIVSSAGRLSRSLRAVPDVVYYSPMTFKDEEFEPGRMECLNLTKMITQSPYEKKEVNGYERAVLKDGHDHEGEAIVRVVCFPGLVAYRQHGGLLAQQELKDEENERRGREGREKLPPDVQKHRRMLASHEKKLTGDEGFRTREISKSVVLLQWGKQRLLTKEAGTSRHIDAMKDKSGPGMKKYTDDYNGFEELHQIFKRKTQGAPESTGYFGGWISRSPSGSVEPTSKSQARGRAGSNAERPGSRGRR